MKYRSIKLRVATSSRAHHHPTHSAFGLDCNPFDDECEDEKFRAPCVVPELPTK